MTVKATAHSEPRGSLRSTSSCQCHVRYDVTRDTCQESAPIPLWPACHLKPGSHRARLALGPVSMVDRHGIQFDIIKHERELPATCSCDLRLPSTTMHCDDIYVHTPLLGPLDNREPDTGHRAISSPGDMDHDT